MINIYKSKTYLKDLDYLITNTSIFEELNNSTIFVTGATGLIGSAVVDLLFRTNELSKANINVIVAGRSENNAIERFSRYCGSHYFSFYKYDATKKNNFDFDADYIIHSAGNSCPRDIQGNSIDTMLENFTALYEILSYSDLKKIKSTLFISSSEIYGIIEDAKPYTENQYGYIDILNSRSSYSSGKRAGETLCSCFSNERNVHTVIARPGHVYGPTLKESDNHVVSSFIFDAINGKKLIMKSSGLQMRSYCYSLDVASAILNLLIKGKNANAYNISDPLSSITIVQMAEILAEICNVEIVFNKENKSKDDVNPMQNSCLNGDKLNKIGWSSFFNVKTGLEHTVRIIKEASV